jgi:ABC-2 type transport system ATP-binding protein
MIRVDDIGKTFRPPGGLRELVRGRLFQPSVSALSGITFEVKPREIVCIMGPNGAGKTTLLRILAGLLAPTAGRAEVAGHDVEKAGRVLRREISYVVGDERSFYPPLSGRQNLGYFAALHGLPPRIARARIDGLLACVGLEDASDRRFSHYSRGMKQRLALARGLLGDPRVLLLDEPTLGLDPRGAQDLRRLLRDEVIRDGGRTALVGSNDPAEVRALADRVLFLEGGRLRGETTADGIETGMQVYLGLGRD